MTNVTNVTTNLVFTIIPNIDDSNEKMGQVKLTINIPEFLSSFKFYSSLITALYALNSNNCHVVVIPCLTEDIIKIVKATIENIFNRFLFNNLKEVILTL